MVFFSSLDAQDCRTIRLYVICFVYAHILSLFLQQLTQDKNSFYDLTDRDMDGNEVKMDKFKGDVLCVVNVASK